MRTSSRLLGLVESDSEDGLGRAGVSISTRPRAQQFKESRMPAAKAKSGRGRQATKVTKPAQKSSTRRASGRMTAALEAAAEEERVALAAKSGNEQQPQGKKPAAKGRRGAVARTAVDEDDIAMDDAPALVTPPASDATAAAAKPRTTRGRSKKAAPEDNEAADSAGRDSAPMPRGRGGRKATKAAAKEAEPPIEEESEIVETQQLQQPQPEADSIAVDELESEEEQLEDLPAPFLGPLPSIHSTGRAPSSALRRPASADSFGGSDPALRRRLGEMTKRCESLELKYRDLRDIGIKEAERNFDRLKKQGEEKANAANTLIASLKADLAAQKELARDGQRLRRQLEASEAKANGLQARVTELVTALSESKTEAKALTMKLSASRNAEAAATATAAVAANKVPGSALKGGGMRTGAGAVEAIQQAAQVAQMKEDLYADLTGLIVRGVKHEGAEHVYDCIQTGRNGTLHFKLALADRTSSDSYDETQFRYMPQLDPSRDRELIDILPDYLVEDITFPRPHAAKFYARVMKSLTERPE